MTFGYLTCTRCFRPTHSKPDWGNIGAAAAIELCENWLCDDCLDEADRERADAWKARFADRMARMIGDTTGCAVAAEAAWDDCAGDVDPEEAAEAEVSEWRESS